MPGLYPLQNPAFEDVAGPETPEERYQRILDEIRRINTPQPRRAGIRGALADLLPLLIAGGVGGLAGGKIGAGSALETAGASEMKRRQLEQERREQRTNTLEQLLARLDKQRSEARLEHGERRRAVNDAIGKVSQHATGVQANPNIEPEQMGESIRSFGEAMIQGGQFTDTEKQAIRQATEQLAKTPTKVKREKPFAGRDVPLPPDVEAQQRRIRAAGQVLPPEAEAQRKRIAAAGQVLSPEAEAQRTRIAQAGVASRLTLGEEFKDLPNSTVTKLEDLGSSIKVLSDIKVQMPVLEPMIGPVAGRWTKVKQVFGQTTTEQEAALSTVQEYFNVLAKLRSGGAVTPQEEARLKRELQEPGLTPAQFRGRLETQEKFLRVKLGIVMGGLSPAKRAKALEALESVGVGARPRKTVEIKPDGTIVVK